MADDDLAEMSAALEIAVCAGCRLEREYAINHGSQPMQRDSPVHRYRGKYYESEETMTVGEFKAFDPSTLS